MKHLTLLLWIGLLSFYSFGQTRMEYYDHEWKKCDQKMAFFSGQLAQTDSGFVAKDYYVSNGQLQMTGKYTDFDRKIKNGHFTYYFTDGTISGEGVYQADQRNGIWKSYHPNGQLKSLFYYSNNVVVGIGKSWHSNGQLEDSLYTIKDVAMMTSWFPNGILSASGAVGKNTKRPVGSWTYYRMDGTKSAQVLFDAASKVISKAYYDKEGNLLKLNKKRNYGAYFNNEVITWKSYKKQNLREPEGIALPKGKKKVVVVGFLIDPYGAVKDAYVKVPLHPEYDKIALELFKNCPRWIPALHYNRDQRTSAQLYTIDFDKIKKSKLKS